MIINRIVSIVWWAWCFFMFDVLVVQAQNKDNETAEIIARIYEDMSANSEADIDFSTLEEDLNYFAQNPVNLNNTTKEELQKLQFLSDQQIENLLYYLYRNKPINSLYELQLVDGFDEFTIRNLLPFVYVGKMTPLKSKLPSLATIFSEGKHEFLWRTDRTLEQKEGYTSTDNDSLALATNKKYVGDPYYCSLRYIFRYRDRIDMGLIAEKDAGEQFWGSYHKGFDYYSAYLQLNDIGILKSLVIGNFRANFGQGLVIHPELTYSKANDVVNVLPQNAGIRKCSSTDEYNYMRGIGVTLKKGISTFSLFYSYRFLDGDSTGNAITTIKTDGLHQTMSDLARKGTIGWQVIGGNMSWRFRNLHVGATLTDMRLSIPLHPTIRLDNRFDFSGTHQLAGGVNYQFRLHPFNFFGETAMTDQYAVATINGCSFSPISIFQIVALYRHYSPRYSVLLSNGFAEGSSIQNEDGYYFGVKANPIKHWQFSFAADTYSFPWLKYSVGRPSNGYDLLLTAHYVSSHALEMFWKIRYKQKEKNFNTATTTYFTGEYSTTNGYYSLAYKLDNHFALKNIIAVNHGIDAITKSHTGYLLAQDFSYTPSRVPLAINMRYEFFDSPAYDTRFYVYEKDLLYVFAIPMLYGKGSRYFLNMRYTMNQHLTFWFKIAQTIYEEVNTVGTGLETIHHNHKTDARAMLRWKF
ncbi:helix-hairpin-helix domain-containing protein [Microbacter margulisiae]|uniref:Helix-hairpin-helix motif-containing protein n=1 Tax=Microbacter margulisiae TaxID=1350067 RepID=A0A7W5DQG1_9PORP|nr:helix-hairpin-helix domain-containing protein [Microbacter margulisiae]MBB3187147.1 hypothetical protein [Microbacter margulisiae]